jgi:UDP-N-acetylmuramoyl-L-alanyl-D-glutamate--2,6-diaminopimelate ligase
MAARPLVPPSARELSDFEQLERSVRDRLGQVVTRPTRAPFPWAERLFTLGVTGTNGKTTTAHLIAALLREARHDVILESTLGYFLNDTTLDVPRTSAGFVTAMKHAVESGARFASVEVTSAALARGYARVWRYDLGVFTNLSRDHVAAHGSWEHYLASKAQLFVHLGPGATAVLNAADPAALLVDQVTPPDVKRRYFASAARGPQLCPAELAATEIQVSHDGTYVQLAPSPVAEALGGELELRFIGAVFAENALAATLAAMQAGVGADSARRALARTAALPGRFQVIARNPTVVVDYAHSPDALLRTADTARALSDSGRVIFVFGAGGGADAPKREDMGRVVGERADYVVLTSDNPRHESAREIAAALERGCRRGGRAHVRIQLDRRAAIRAGIELARARDVVVIAGKGHELVQVVGDLTESFSDVEEAQAALGIRGSV